MIISISIDLSGDDAMNAQTLYEILQGFAPSDCELWAKMEVDEQLDYGASISVNRVD